MNRYFSNLKKVINQDVKNLFNWPTKRKIVIFSVDDYGNVRVDSKLARERMDKAGLKVRSRFDAFDSLENREDLEILFDTLTSVKDSQGRHAVFTAFALPCNLNFEGMAENKYAKYCYESLPETYRKLESRDPRAYEGTWPLWQQGITSGIMIPQFHGREHFNLKFFKRFLAERNRELMVSVENRSLVSISEQGDPGGWTASFAFWDVHQDTAIFPEIIKTGLENFKKTFGYNATVFTAPAQQFPLSLEAELSGYGLKAFDRPFCQARHLGKGKFKRQFSFTGYRKNKNLVYLVRNVVFEPTHGKIDHVTKAMQQIEAAFRWNRPAIISSHRVNFCGHIDAQNRAKGLGDLRLLLKKITQRWPDVEFLSADELRGLIRSSYGVD